MHLTARKVKIKSTSAPFGWGCWKGSNKIHETSLALCFCWVGGVECYELSYVRHLTVRKVQKKATYADFAASFWQDDSKRVSICTSNPWSKDKFTLFPGRQKGSNKIHETLRCFCLASCFCWVGGVECYELSYAKHLTIREVKIKATSADFGSASNRTTQKGFPFVLATPEAKTCSATKSSTSEETGSLLFFHRCGSTSIWVIGRHTGKLLGMGFTLAVASAHGRRGKATSVGGMAAVKLGRWSGLR